MNDLEQAKSFIRAELSREIFRLVEIYGYDSAMRRFACICDMLLFENVPLVDVIKFLEADCDSTRSSE